MTLILLSSCRTAQDKSLIFDRDEEKKEFQASEKASLAEEQLSEEPEIRKEAERIISGMTLDEKIGQLFILAVRHTAYGKPALNMDSYLQNYMEKYKPGGLILFSINFNNPEQTRNLISGLQMASPIPLFIATDEEGGRVSRLGQISQMDVIALPPAGELGETANPGWLNPQRLYWRRISGISDLI